MKEKKEFPVLGFPSPEKWEAWLHKNHAKSDGVWLRFHKKGSGVQTVVYAEALDAALCYGWIDSQAKKYDATSYIQKFTPRRSKSIWSKVNRGKVAALIKAGRMKAAGLAAIEAAKADGRWKAAYDSPRNIRMPAEFLRALGTDKKARAFFDTLNKANTYAIAWRIQTAKKPETRARRIAQFVKMMAEGRKLH